MVVEWANDGKIYEKDKITNLGFHLDENRDISYVNKFDKTTGEKKDEKEWIYDFVGFVTNNENDLLVVYPKHYLPVDVELEAKLIFDCFIKHMQKKPDMYIGNKAEEIFKSNFPFAAFFLVYDHFLKYGLYRESKEYVRKNMGGKVSWKDTISRGIKYFDGNDLIISPLYYKKKWSFSNFFTECMIFVIDYTIEKFKTFISLEETGMDFPEFDFLEEKEYVLCMLAQLKQQTFKDSELLLIDSLIEFFEQLNIGGSYYIKHYYFSAVWEDMVMDFLREYYKEIKGNKIVLDKSTAKHFKFEKVAFHPNSAKTTQYIAPDYYYSDGSTQLIFDAKYYNNFYGMDYKQIAYYFLLKEYHDAGCVKPKYSKTYSALIAPFERRESRLHFSMSDLHSFSDKDFVITEEYFDIREVMLYYTSRN